jgi:hypothetical protein
MSPKLTGKTPSSLAAFGKSSVISVLFPQMHGPRTVEDDLPADRCSKKTAIGVPWALQLKWQIGMRKIENL